VAGQIIFTADDFGASPSINAAVISAHLNGVLTSASLMVAGDAAQEALDMARATPSLAVGLHVVVVSGRSTLSPKHIPHLVDHAGRFRENPLAAGLYYLGRQARQELAYEMEAQFDHFAASGLTLSHVDSHTHFHIHPTVFNIIVRLSKQHNAGGMRMPNDELALGLQYDASRAALKIAWSIVFSCFRRLYLPRLSRAKLAVAERVYGLMQTGQMKEDYVISLLKHIQARTVEIYFHPDKVAGSSPLGPNPGDLATLLSPSLRRTIEERQFTLATYRLLERR
jgi:hopanoid biosynthesis associated protein HpnK